MNEVKVIEGYRITLPVKYRERTGIKKGDKLKYEIKGEKLILSVKRGVDNPTKRLFGIAVGVSEDVKGDNLFLEEVKVKLRRSG